MIREGLEYSNVSTGFTYVLLRVPKDEFWKLYYYLCEPNVDAYKEGTEIKIENTAIARVLCFCLMSCQSSTPRNQVWRNQAKERLRTWGEHYDAHLAQACDTPRTPPGPDHTKSGSEYLPSSPPSERVAEGRRFPTRSMTNHCKPPEDSRSRPSYADSSDSDNVSVAQGQKRGFSQVMSSPTSERASSTPPARPYGVTTIQTSSTGIASARSDAFLGYNVAADWTTHVQMLASIDRNPTATSIKSMLRN